jgi:hypothetical protein
LWTNRSFSGDLCIEFDFVKRDTATKFVNILYLYAEGSGVGDYKKDISQWNDLRKIPAMKTYYDNMNALHISFAAYENDNIHPFQDYIRARRYLPEHKKGLEGTELKPDYTQTALFQKDRKYHITVIRHGKEVLMKIENSRQNYLCHWQLADEKDLSSGRIGLRLMGSRISEFGNFKVYSLNN